MLRGEHSAYLANYLGSIPGSGSWSQLPAMLTLEHAVSGIGTYCPRGRPEVSSRLQVLAPAQAVAVQLGSEPGMGLSLYVCFSLPFKLNKKKRKKRKEGRKESHNY